MAFVVAPSKPPIRRRQPIHGSLQRHKQRLVSINSSTAGYWDETGQFKNLSLISREPMQVWVDYDGLSSNRCDDGSGQRG
ncbi:unnamed protein product [Microthlaspi erraticum]|uniref:Legume lectin domain-containing protein n=1 Tax=Microthlaspi erraticum TaxID=1685480 RepID=A0A6D2LEC2_9BRAS|nr:unnamed protein product [Microthlaspi erraticum]